MAVDTDAELLRLQAALRDLVALSAIPAAWAGREPPAMAAGLADALVALLQLDSAFVRLSYPDRAGAVDVTRGNGRRGFPEWLEDHAATRVRFPGKAIVADVGDDSEPCRAVALPIGVNGDGGLVAAASERSDFPTAVEQVLLSLAANQAATAFQNACLIDERRKAEDELRVARDELEVNVAERTAELHQANDTLSALRRVATLVAEGVQPQDLFAVVAEEIARVVDVPLVLVARYEPDGTATGCASFPGEDSRFPVGKRWSLEGTNVLGLVRESSESARIDDFSGLEGAIADSVRRTGIRSTVGVPIVVAGRVWGAMVVSTTEHDPLPRGTEARLADFTELLATAIENAESREALLQLADEQATLRRMATLVAQGVSPDEIFSAVSDEVGRLLGSDTAAVVRFEHDPPAIVVVGVGQSISGIPIGTRSELDDTLASTEVYRTGRPARIDARDPAFATGPIHEAGRRHGLTSTVASPIIVESRLWGTISVSAKEPLPLGTGDRLEKFTELVATAIANAESREALGRLADEQAALRRVATLAARGVAPEEVFAAVTEEVGRLLGAGLAGMARYEGDDTVTVLATWAAEAEHGGAHPLVPGPWPLGGGDLASTISRKGQPVRIDTYEGVPGRIAAFVRDELGIGSSVGSPIVVEGQLWGALFLHTKQTHRPLPRDTESRLTGFTELVATAIANAESRSELMASRARIVAASDEARRRIERDLHDGTQQRLVSLGLALRAAEAEVEPGSTDVRSKLSRIATGLADAVAELQELSRGIHPAILSQGGLAPALRTLARRSPIPVELDIATDTRLPEPIEVAAYYVASEALANAAKHAQASRVDVSLAPRNSSLLVSIRDDGVGGADPARGSGLVGLTDRIEALGGSILVQSRPGAGTQVTVELPLELELRRDPEQPSA
jgi:signal transduction histidine kinase